MEEKKSCRWGVLIRQASVFARFKNKLRLKKLEWKEFFDQFKWPVSESETEFQEWPDSSHGTEGSCSSHYNSQYFDSLTPEEASEFARQQQIPNVLGHQSSVPMVPSSLQHEFRGMGAQEGESRFSGTVGSGFDDGMIIDSQDWDHTQQLPAPWMDHMDSFDSTPLSVNEYLDEYADTISECPQFDEQMRVQRNLSSPLLGNRSISAPVTSMNIDMTGNVDMRNTGNSSRVGDMRPEDRLQWFKQFFDVGVEETLTKTSTGRGWRVVVRIVCACRKLARLLRTRKLERNSSGQITPRKRSRGFGENRSQLYKGVRRRNGKWVSEVRIGQTNEKVWLGSYDTEKEAALAFDAGKFYCSAKRCRSFNFPDSPRLLGPQINLRDLSPKERKKTIQRLAEDHAKACAAAKI